MNQISVFDHPKPGFTAETAAELLRRDYGISGAMKELVSERDQNYLVEGGQGSFVLKIANAAEDHGFLELQNVALKHLAAVDPGLGVQRLVPAMNGAEILQWVSANWTHAVRLLTYLPGQLFSSVENTPALLGSLGQFMGRLSRAMRGFGHRAAHREVDLGEPPRTCKVPDSK